MTTQKQTKIFCGQAKNFGQYGGIAISLCLSDLPKEYITTAQSGKKYIKLKLGKIKNPDQKRDYYVEVDTWKPGQKQQVNATIDLNKTEEIDADKFVFDGKEDIPF